MPTPISHATVGLAIAAWTGRGIPSRRLCLVAAACAAVPDIDLVGWPLHMSDASLFSHRAITHSLVFALIGALAATTLLYRPHQWAQKRPQIAGVLLFAFLSHPCLDALSTYSVGVEFLAPFSRDRFRFLWTPLGGGGLESQLVQEAIVVLLPAMLVGWLGLRIRRSSGPPRAAAA